MDCIYLFGVWVGVAPFFLHDGGNFLPINQALPFADLYELVLQ